jgi:hypothetical protein
MISDTIFIGILRLKGRHTLPRPHGVGWHYHDATKRLGSRHDDDGFASTRIISSDFGGCQPMPLGLLSAIKPKSWLALLDKVERLLMSSVELEKLYACGWRAERILLAVGAAVVLIPVSPPGSRAPVAAPRTGATKIPEISSS